jgi:hypothetical protein
LGEELFGRFHNGFRQGEHAADEGNGQAGGRAEAEHDDDPTADDPVLFHGRLPRECSGSFSFGTATGGET